MANNAQFPGVQPLRPPIPLGPPQGAPPSMSMQFRPVVPVPLAPAQQSQPYNPVASQQFQQVGCPNVGLPSHGQHFQFSQPVQPLPPRPGIGGLGVQPPQAIAIPEVQLNRPSISISPRPLQNAQVSNSFVSNLSGPGMPLSSPYTFGTSSGGNLQRNADASTQYQPISQTNVATFPVAGQSWPPTGSQSTTSVPPTQKIVEQHSAINPVVPVATLEPNLSEILPSDWLEHTARNGKKYYYNKITKRSTWEKPLDLMTPIEKADASTDWKEYQSPDERKYYYNRVTKESKWTIPEELKLAREQLKMASIKESLAGNDNSPAPVDSLSMVKASPQDTVTSSSLDHGVASSPIQLTTVETPGSSTSPAEACTVKTNAIEVMTPSESVTPVAAVSGSNVSDTAAPDVGNTGDGASVEATEEAEEGKGSVGKVNVTALVEKTVVPEPLIYENKLEAKNAFKALLESANIGSEWTWDQAMRVIINDQRYGALRTLGERKQAFNEFLGKRKKQDAEDRRARQKKAQEDFRRMLEESKELKPSTRWSKAVALFEDDERFKALERNREDLFDDYILELEKKERAKAMEEHRRNRVEYLNFLKSCDFITASSQWRKVQDRLEADERCLRLEKIDRLEIFQEYTRDLEREEEEEMKLRMEELRKAERKNRDEFRKLMEGHVASGILTAETHWRDYCMKVKESPAYLAVSSNTSGSTAKDLFEDVAEELQKQYLEDKARIKDVMKLRKITLSSTWTLEDFKAAITEDISSPTLSDINLKLIFHELRERAKEKEEKEAKKRKRQADDFYDLICTSKDITASSKWEDCRKFLEDRQESWSIGEDSIFREIFEKYVTDLKEKEKEKERKRRDDKAKRERDAKDREKKERHIRDEGRGYESKSGKDRKHNDSADKTESYVAEEKKRSGKGKDKKHRKRHLNSPDDFSLDENEKHQSKDSHRHSSDRKKMKQVEQRSISEIDSESRHKRHKKNERSGSYRKGDSDD